MKKSFALGAVVALCALSSSAAYATITNASSSTADTFVGETVAASSVLSHTVAVGSPGTTIAVTDVTPGAAVVANSSNATLAKWTINSIEANHNYVVTNLLVDGASNDHVVAQFAKSQPGTYTSTRVLKAGAATNAEGWGLYVGTNAAGGLAAGLHTVALTLTDYSA